MTIPWNPITCSVKSSSFWQSQPENVEAQVARAARAARLATCYNKPGAYEVPRSAISWSCCGSRKKINLSICTSTAMKSYECRLWNQNLLWNPMGTWLLDCLTATSKTIVASPDVGHCYESWETSARPKMYVRPSHQMESIPESAGTMGTMIHLDSPNIFSN